MRLPKIELCAECAILATRLPDVPLARPAEWRDLTTVVPEGFRVTKCPTRTAAGAHRTVRGGSGGDTRPPVTPTNILSLGYVGRAVRGYAATAKGNVR